jgi:hypothetical protein
MASEPKKKEFDKRKFVLLGIVFLIILVFITVGSSKVDSKDLAKKGVQGVTTRVNNPVNEIRSAIQDKIETIQTEAKNVDIAEVASSSPQVQKIINDIKSIENYPSDQAKGLCEKICSGL